MERLSGIISLGPKCNHKSLYEREMQWQKRSHRMITLIFRTVWFISNSPASQYVLREQGYGWFGPSLYAQHLAKDLAEKYPGDMFRWIPEPRGRPQASLWIGLAVSVLGFVPPLLDRKLEDGGQPVKHPWLCSAMAMETPEWELHLLQCHLLSTDAAWSSH